ncbi:MAG: hypothetical protein OHK0013_19290 [Sandaracinaceae bacterium]
MSFDTVGLATAGGAGAPQPITHAPSTITPARFIVASACSLRVGPRFAFLGARFSVLERARVVVPPRFSHGGPRASERAIRCGTRRAYEIATTFQFLERAEERDP